MIGADLIREAASHAADPGNETAASGVDEQALVEAAQIIVFQSLRASGKLSEETLVGEAGAWCAGFMAGVYAARVQQAEVSS